MNSHDQTTTVVFSFLLHYLLSEGRITRMYSQEYWQNKHKIILNWGWSNFQQWNVYQFIWVERFSQKRVNNERMTVYQSTVFIIS